MIMISIIQINSIILSNLQQYMNRTKQLHSTLNKLIIILWNKKMY